MLTNQTFRVVDFYISLYQKSSFHRKGKDSDICSNSRILRYHAPCHEISLESKLNVKNTKSNTFFLSFGRLRCIQAGRRTRWLSFFTCFCFRNIYLQNYEYVLISVIIFWTTTGQRKRVDQKIMTGLPRPLESRRWHPLQSLRRQRTIRGYQSTHDSVRLDPYDSDRSDCILSYSVEMGRPRHPKSSRWRVPMHWTHHADMTDTIKEIMVSVCACSCDVCSFHHSSEIGQTRCSIQLSRKGKTTTASEQSERVSIKRSRLRP